jgi:hypothetical protein
MSASSQVSEARLEANRANAQQSTGPQTPEGKSRTRLNGLRHGLTGQTVVMPFEDRKAYERHTARIIESLQPETVTERDLALSIANDKWRLNRARAIEENLFAIGAEDCPIEYPGVDARTENALTQAESFVRFAKEFQLLTLYESRISRSLKASTAELERLQAARRADEARRLEEETLLAQLAESKGETWDPCAAWQGEGLTSSHDRFGNPRPPLPSGANRTANGFGFSTSEIARSRHRQLCLIEARQLAGLTPQHLKEHRKAA